MLLKSLTGGVKIVFVSLVPVELKAHVKGRYSRTERAAVSVQNLITFFGVVL